MDRWTREQFSCEVKSRYECGGTYACPMYCIAAQVPARIEPGLSHHMFHQHSTQTTMLVHRVTDLDPAMVGEAYTPPFHSVMTKY